MKNDVEIRVTLLEKNATIRVTTQHPAFFEGDKNVLPTGKVAQLKVTVNGKEHTLSVKPHYRRVINNTLTIFAEEVKA